MKIIENIDKIWEFMYLSSYAYLQDIISSEDLSELTMSDREYIGVIKKLKRPKLSEIAKSMGYTKTSVTNMVTKLENKGYLKRIKSKTDKREIIIELTEKGEALFKWDIEMYQRTLEEMKNALTSEELLIYEVLMEKIGKQIDEVLPNYYNKVDKKETIRTLYYPLKKI
ncbi:transcriptional regulator, MarR family [Methanococcus vannielii SB]|uniref:Transcriptional regulator, MarR family n=1 Tax=Methanococcus vannielii (strain ATCC 35089 / DSM 1224 / JCM 13029 / OCM 148 / SB) TaxID=406327 RepID=A6UNH5_METVS|nr:MarR family transcriptional regulator [Methanococcus vannielii]ABR54047.1 transcriptional regulator, MarR family [Methanococcus vannielii SB]